MKKLNNKGYMLVEIIAASVIALVMAYFLIDITVKLTNKNNDYYIESSLLMDKNLITKEIMDDISDGGKELIGVSSCGEKCYNLEFSDGSSKVLAVLKKNGITYIKYGDYQKELSPDLIVGDDIVFTNQNGILNINIPCNTNYSKTDYDINILIPYKGNVNIEIPNNEG